MLLLAVLSALASDLPVLVLPASEDPGAWIAASRLAGLTVGSPHGSAWIEVEDRGPTWVIRARDAEGREKRVEIARPSTPSAREDAAWVAASLLRELEAPADGGGLLSLVPGKTAGKPTRRAESTPAASEPPLVIEVTPPPPPSSLVVEPTGPTVAVTPEDPTVRVEEAPATVAVEALETDPPQLRPWARLCAVGAWRAGISLGGGFSGAAGVALASVHLGVEASWTTPRSLWSVAPDALMTATDLGAGAWWGPDGALAPWAGVVAGASARSFYDGATLIRSVWVPVAAAEGGVAIRLGHDIRLVPLARVAVDLAAINVRVGDEGAPLSPWQPGASVALTGRIE